MNSHWQTFASLALVALAAGGLVWRAWRRRPGSGGCAEGCCSSGKLKQGLAKRVSG